ncbi:hypothetical protein JCM19046_495 [Bacillus sp. JCM 19046]|uniref:Uncharacterized protein n=1 Tax=Shouchella xiaoxiensis TaxID=766895 RepID=A0ABS2ST19_9BACI|nr:hypothetical protein [Shouchella xiaoxiensis]MBM7838642.1 hypothetical protein [Shouchella xiaoxiensis]GAF11790.1 hypothetical protein JCM19045_927 [Bacillus sp. JCM 19045]GAF16085.1 hypothetical protein JCM19046_495 [Bacillus sp. JCM 19046]
MNRERYYVTVDMAMLQISDLKLPDNTIQYEIYATSKEVDQIQALIDQIRSEDFRQEEVFQRPFQEKEADRDKDRTDNELQQLYTIIYDLGTIETKEVVKDLK